MAEEVYFLNIIYLCIDVTSYGPITCNMILIIPDISECRSVRGIFPSFNNLKHEYHCNQRVNRNHNF